MNIITKLKRILNLPDYLDKHISNQLEIANFKKLSLESNLVGVSSNKLCSSNVTISLTTHSKRIFNVHLTIESLMRQTFKPNNIVLWLGKDQFCENTIPHILNRYRERGLTINFVEDIRSYTKLIPALEKFPDDVIVTVDDDLIYRHDMLENLIKPFTTNPNYIYFNRGHRMVLKDNVLVPYRNWDWSIEDSTISVLNFPTGVGGVLYPPKSFDDEVLNSKIFLKLCPLADDVWFKAMATLKGTQSRKVSTFHPRGLDYILIDESQLDGLQVQNVGQNKNDEQIKATFHKYGLMNKLN